MKGHQAECALVGRAARRSRRPTLRSFLWLIAVPAVLALNPAIPQAATATPITAHAVAPPAPATAAIPAGIPGDAAALGGFNVLIADRGNNRVLIVSPDKQIVWEYDFVGLPRSTGADDAFFADGGKSIIVSLEHQQVIELIDIATKQVTWHYGDFGKRGARDGRLNFPDDAYQLASGDVMVADIRNCRILEIAPDGGIVRQAGITDRCGSTPTLFASPNGDTPLPDGRVLVSTIRDHSLIELDANWQQVLKLSLPVRYPSDPQLTGAGNFLVSSYTHPGRIIEIARDGKLVWDYTAAGEGGLNRPSLAIELPNGNIMANDDLNHRVIVVDKASKKILWQYGVTGRRGTAPGYLAIPDGLDIIKAN
jgi:outer membrane protein assembly factor BamB